MTEMEWNMGEYIRKIAYLFHYKNGNKGESVGYIKVSVRNGKGNLNVQLRLAKEYIESLRVCILSESGQVEELGKIDKKEGVFEATYLYEGKDLDTLLTLSGLFLPEGEEYYGARLDGKDLTEQMVKGALSAHVQAFAEEFAKASSETASVVETELQFPFLEELYAAELSKTMQKVSEESIQAEPIEERIENVQQKELRQEQNELENEQKLAWEWLCELEKKRRMNQEEEIPQWTESKIEAKDRESQKETEGFQNEMPQWIERDMEEKETETLKEIVEFETKMPKWTERHMEENEIEKPKETLDLEAKVPKWTERNMEEREIVKPKETPNLEVEIPKWTEQNMQQKKEEWTTEQQYEILLKQFPTYRPMECASFLHSVRIEPKDILLFPREARMLAENSFLLHSFYQYKHLLFAKKQIERQIEYWLMVPGVFRYRDLYLANTFGFTSFWPIREECRRRQKKQGEFGYWYLKLA